jgi:hypothetical protein
MGKMPGLARNPLTSLPTSYQTRREPDISIGSNKILRCVRTDLINTARPVKPAEALLLRPAPGQRFEIRFPAAPEVKKPMQMIRAVQVGLDSDYARYRPPYEL